MTGIGNFDNMADFASNVVSDIAKVGNGLAGAAGSDPSTTSGIITAVEDVWATFNERILTVLSHCKNDPPASVISTLQKEWKRTLHNATADIEHKVQNSAATKRDLINMLRSLISEKGGGCDTDEDIAEKSPVLGLQIDLEWSAEAFKYLETAFTFSVGIGLQFLDDEVKVYGWYVARVS